MTAPHIDYAAGWRGVPGWLDPIEGACLEAAVQSTTGAIVELGTWAGRSLVCLAAARDLAKQERPLVSFDPYPESGQAQVAGQKDMDFTPAEAKAVSNLAINVFCVRNVFRFYVDAIKGAEEYRKHPHLAAFKIGLLYIDDHHSSEHVLAELAAWEPLLADDCEVLLHDFFHEPYGLQAALDRFMLEHPEWVMVEAQLSMARLRRRWRVAPRASSPHFQTLSLDYLLNHGSAEAGAA